MTITLIAAMDRNRTIGSGNKLPWRLPAEMALFTKHTLGKTVLMGRKTFESLPKPLKDRRNIVLTRQSDFAAAGCDVIHTMEEALEIANFEDLMVIGGAELYSLFLPYADRMHVTEVEAEVAGGDAYFPEWKAEEWVLTSSEHHDSDEKNVYAFTFQTFERQNGQRTR